MARRGKQALMNRGTGDGDDVAAVAPRHVDALALQLEAEVGRRLVWLRGQTGLDVDALAATAGIPVAECADAERGDVSVRTLIRLARFHRVPARALLAEGTDPPALVVPAPAGQTPVPVFGAHQLRVLTSGDTPTVYVPSAMLARAMLHEPFALRVGETLTGAEPGSAAGDLLLCERDVGQYLATHSEAVITVVVVVQGQARLVRTARDCAEELPKLGRVTGVVVGGLQLRSAAIEAGRRQAQ